MYKIENDSNGLTRVVVDGDHASGQLYLQGAHCTAWRPAGHEPVLWMSDKSNFALGKPIRGGVPICFPWFGPHSTKADAPAHGTARTTVWNLDGSLNRPRATVRHLQHQDRTVHAGIRSPVRPNADLDAENFLARNPCW